MDDQSKTKKVLIDELIDARRELTTAEKEIKRMNRAITVLEKKMQPTEQLQQQVAELEASLAEAKKSLTQSKKTVSSHNRKLSALQETMLEQQAEHDTRLKNIQSKFARNESSLEAENKQLLTRVERLEKELNEVIAQTPNGVPSEPIPRNAAELAAASSEMREQLKYFLETVAKQQEMLRKCAARIKAYDLTSGAHETVDIRKVSTKAKMSLPHLVVFLENFVSALKTGDAKISRGTETIVLSPSPIIRLSAKGAVKKNDSKMKISLSWPQIDIVVDALDSAAWDLGDSKTLK
jgi:amphi-Trp domain-containing protein